MHAPRPHADGFLLAHVSDPHLTDPGGVRWSELLNKRLSGYLSWQRRRRHVHCRERLALLVEDLRRQHPDHVAVTGDLTQIGTPGECRQALDWLQALGPPHQVSVVPGNHDAYVRAPYADTIGLWRDYMTGDAGDGFPYLRRRGGVALVGVSTARPSGLSFATGRLGDRQLDALESLLAACREEGLCRVLLIHHPPQPGTVSWRKRLTDGARLRQVLARTGVELVLHGHAHRCLDGWLDVPDGRAPVLGVSSASAVYPSEAAVAAYSLIRIEPRAESWAMELRRRLIRPDGCVDNAPAVALTPGPPSVQAAH